MAITAASVTKDMATVMTTCLRTRLTPSNFRAIMRNPAIAIPDLDEFRRDSAAEHVEIHAEGDGADHLMAAGIDDGEAHLGLELLRRLVHLDVVDEHGIRAHGIGLHPLVFVALPIIGGDVALAHIQALAVHDDDLGVEAAGVVGDVLEITR